MFEAMEKGIEKIKEIHWFLPFTFTGKLIDFKSNILSRLH